MAKYLICISLIICSYQFVFGQSYKQDILKYREHYITELLTEKRHPVLPTDVRYLKFYEPDAKYCIWATFTETPGNNPIMFATHTSKNKPFKEYGYLEFSINDTLLKLHVYQSIDLVNDLAHKDDLFIPFNDYTNYETTFGGGRYIDISIKDITQGRVLLDFNKCYNPYCAYADGFSCPIPPDENKLHIEIRAGEQLYMKYLGK